MPEYTSCEMMNNEKGHDFQLLWLTIFAISMGFLETAVVVYLRELMYPAGFSFPLSPINSSLAKMELLREAATLLMLVSLGCITGRTRFEKFVLFLYTFAIWDIFYYIFLKLMIGWPDSVLTWDILFLVPVTWTGPVLAPLVSSVTMIFLSVLTFQINNQVGKAYMNLSQWLLLIAGAGIQLLAFIWDYSKYILHYYSLRELWNLHGDKALYTLSIHYIPAAFNWWLFIAGELLIVVSIFLFYRMNHRRII